MPDNDTAEQTGTVVVLLGAAVVLVLVDLLFLGIAIAFGPSGFGGDGHLSSTKALREELGQFAGFTGLLLGAAALACGSIGTLVLKSTHARNLGLKWVVGAQLLATVALVVSTH